MARTICDWPKCPSLAMPAARAREKLGPTALGGMCEIHTMRTSVAMAADHLPASAWEHKHTVPVDPYRQWLQDAVASGQVTYKGLTVRDLRRRELAELTGLHDVTISKIANGHTSWARPKVHRALTPYIVLTSTEPTWTVKVGQWVHLQRHLQYVPPGTGVVDSYGRLWQLRAGDWCPAHPPGETSRFLENTEGTYQFRLPVRVVHLPPVLQADTTA